MRRRARLRERRSAHAGLYESRSIRKDAGNGYAHYYSRSRQKLWKKGEESGHLQEVVSVSLDCDGDCVLLRVRQTGAACHTGNYSCFFNTVKEGGAGAEMLGRLQRVVEDRRDRPEEGSYTCYLFEKGVDKIAKKTGEEAVELGHRRKKRRQGRDRGRMRRPFLSHARPACKRGRETFGRMRRTRRKTFLKDKV